MQDERAATLRGSLDELQQVTARQLRAGLILFASVIAAVGLGAVVLVRRTIIRPVLARSREFDAEAGEISAKADQFKQASESLATGAAESAAALQNSSAALNEMDGLTRANAERAENTKHLAAMDDLDQLTQKDAAMAEETSASAIALGEQTDRLRDVADAFTRLARGGHTTTQQEQEQIEERPDNAEASSYDGDAAVRIAPSKTGAGSGAWRVASAHPRQRPRPGKRLLPQLRSSARKLLTPRVASYTLSAA